MATVNLIDSRTAPVRPAPPATSLKSKVTCVALAVLSAAVVGAGAFLISSSLPISLTAGIITLLLLCAWIYYLNRDATPPVEEAPQTEPMPDISLFSDELDQSNPEAHKSKEPIAPQPSQQPTYEEPEYLRIERERTSRQLKRFCAHLDSNRLW